MAAQRAAEHAEWQLQKTLVDYGAEQNVRRHVAQDTGHPYTRKSYVGAASHVGTSNVVKLLKSRCDPETTGAAWCTRHWRGVWQKPLRIAVCRGHQKRVPLLLQAGANTSLRRVQWQDIQL
eukprot:7934743-Pyramimonas_sp.AAC.1